MAKNHPFQISPKVTRWVDITTGISAPLKHADECGAGKIKPPSLAKSTSLKSTKALPLMVFSLLATSSWESEQNHSSETHATPSATPSLLRKRKMANSTSSDGAKEKQKQSLSHSPPSAALLKRLHSIAPNRQKFSIKAVHLLPRKWKVTTAKSKTPAGKTSKPEAPMAVKSLST